jgi:four helix bundle protein
MVIIKEVYTITGSCPKEELFGLTSQTRRAAVSIAANIAEGIGRNYKKDTIQFLHIARGSLYETETLLEVARSIHIIIEEKYRAIEILLDEELKILNGLIKSFETRTDIK